MALSNDLATLFAKTTQDKQETKKESTAYGKIVKEDGKEYVQLDGSDLLTPISSTTVVNEGDRVLVTIKNHTAIVTGDLTHPSASNKEVQEIGSKISEFEIVIADKVTTKELEAEIARIEKLRVDELEATNAKFETIEGKVAEIDTIKADVVEISGKVTAHEGEFTTLRADIADFQNVTAGRIDAVEGNFHTLESDYATFEETVTNKLTANEASIGKLQTDKLDATTADIKFANIDFSNIGEAAIEKLFSDSGIIEDLIMSDGKVTGELVGVTIKGDLIEGNTVKADKLVIQGEDGLYYKLNVNALGETTASSDEKYQNGLDGSIIVAESITAEKIAVDDLVAFGATIGGFNIDNNAVYSGVKSTIDNTTNGIYLSDDGQMNIGNSNNFVKFYKDQNGAYKLEIQASSIKFGASGTNVEEVITNVSNKVDNIQIGGQNLYIDTKDFINKRNGLYVWRDYDFFTKTDEIYKGFTVMEVSSGSRGLHQRIYVEAGEEYTFSGYVKRTNSVDVVVTAYNSSSDSADITNGGTRVCTTNDEWEYFATTHTITRSGYLHLRVEIRSGSGTLRVCGLKLEKGNKATDWSPAPEDVTVEIDTAKNDAINTAATDATNKANTAQTNATNAANQYTDSQITIVNKKITDEMAEINVTTNSITQKVSSIETTVSTKANSSDVYNKTDVDNKINGIEIGGRNLLLDSKKQNTSPSQYLIATYNIANAPLTIGEQYTISANITSTAERTGWAVYLGGGLYMLSSSFKPLTPGTNTYILSFTLQEHANAGGNFINVYASTTGGTQGSTPIAGTANVNWIKLEKGNKATDWTPAPEDVTDYVDESVDNIMVGGRNYVLNSDGTKQEGFFTNFSSVDEDGYCSHTLRSKKTYTSVVTPGYIFDCRDYEVGSQITLSYDIKYTEWNFPEGTNRQEFHMGQRYTSQSVSGGDTTGQWRSVTWHKMPEVGINGCVLNEWYHVEKTFTVPEPAAEGVSTAKSIQFYNSNADIEASFTFKLRNVKLEKGNKATDWSPAPEDIEATLSEEIRQTTERISSLEVQSNSISASVSEIITTQNSTKDSIDALDENLSTLTKTVNTKIDSDSVDIKISSALQDGVNKVVTTEKGFTFDDRGLTISDSSSEMNTTIDEDGMVIKKGQDEQLVANNEGVIAYDLHAKTYLIVGNNSRFEDYTKNGKKQTGCFWIGDTEVNR